MNKLENEDKRPIVQGIILARGGSKGVHRKNLRTLCGKPMMVYTIEAALNAESLNNVVLSTEDEEIAQVAIQHGVEVIMRPAEYSEDISPIDLALRHAVNEVEQKHGKVEIVVVLYANIPVRKNGIIDRVIDKIISSAADSVQTYVQYNTPPQWAFKIEDDRPIPLEGCYVLSYRRQDLVPAYHPDGAVLAIRRDILMDSKENEGKHGAFLGSVRRAIIQSPEDTVNVDTPFDLLWAEFLLKQCQHISFSREKK